MVISPQSQPLEQEQAHSISPLLLPCPVQFITDNLTHGKDPEYLSSSAWHISSQISFPPLLPVGGENTWRLFILRVWQDLIGQMWQGSAAGDVTQPQQLSGCHEWAQEAGRLTLSIRREAALGRLTDSQPPQMVHRSKGTVWFTAHILLRKDMLSKMPCMVPPRSLNVH